MATTKKAPKATTAPGSSVRVDIPPVVHGGLYRVPPPSPAVEWSIDGVAQAIREHELGMFRRSGQLATHIRRDDRVFATLETRINGSLALSCQMVPSKWTTNTRQAISLARRVDAWWQRRITRPVLGEALRWVVLMGFAVGEVESETRDGTWYPRSIRVHDPQFLRWDWLEERFKLTVMDKGTVPGAPGGTAEIPVTPGDGRWIVWKQAGEQRPWMNGALRALAKPWLVRDRLLEPWARRVEVEGVGIRKAKVPRDTDVNRIRKFLAQIDNVGADSTIRLPEGYDFDILAVDANGGHIFEGLGARCDKAITLTLLGQDFTTEVTGGSNGQARPLARVQQDRIESDTSILASTGREEIIMPWGRDCVPDFDEDAAPMPTYSADEPEDVQAKAQALLTLSQALTGLRALRVNIDPILQRHELQMLSDEPAESPTAPPTPVAAPGAPPFQKLPPPQPSEGPDTSEPTPEDPDAPSEPDP